MREHSGEWKRGFAQAMAGVQWNEHEHPAWKEGHIKAVAGMVFGTLPDKHNLLGKQKESGTWEQEYAYLKKLFPKVEL